MLDLMFELPDQPDGGAYLISEEIVEGRDKIRLADAESPKTKSA